MMFLDNKYKKYYFQLIEKRKKETLPKENVYCESHHIIPKSLGGDNEKNNLVNLLPREHFVAHLLLSKMTVGEDYVKMCWALHKMAFSGINYFGSRDYEWFRRMHSRFISENHPSIKQEWRDNTSKRVLENWENNEERRKKTSERMKQTWRENREKLTLNNKRIAKIGGAAAALVRGVEIEYNGKNYIGWESLKEKTGISKHLYLKYYRNGIDPSFRIGKDGPLTKEEVETHVGKEIR